MAHVKRHIHAGKSGTCFCTISLTAGLGSSKELVRAAKRQLLPGGGMCPAWLPGPQAGVQGFQFALSFLLLPLQKAEGLKGKRLTTLLPKYTVKSVTQHPTKVFVALGMHLNSLLQKPLMQICPFQHFISSFLSLLKSCGANHHCVSLGHNCPSLISNNIPEPQSEQAAEHRCMGSCQEGGESPPLSLMPIPPCLRHTESPHETLPPHTEILFLSPYLQLLQAPALLKKKGSIWAPVPDSHFLQLPYHCPTRSGQEQLHLHASQLLLQGPGKES